MINFLEDYFKYSSDVLTFADLCQLNSYYTAGDESHIWGSACLFSLTLPSGNRF